MTGFRVDTKLFQELGELLVAKESTALVELIKNAYDADATIVTVTGHDLHDTSRGRIIVADDGIGMNADEFRRGFLTIAGRTKNVGDRRSPVFGRRYTGEKGVGRLASHKLGTVLEVHSRKAGPAPRGARALPDAISQLSARIDWSAIEKLETLDQVDTSGAVEVSEQSVASTKSDPIRSGTIQIISPLRKGWTERMRSDFLSEAATLAPLPVTWKVLPVGLAREPLLYEEIPIRDQYNTDPGFEVVFAEDLGLRDRLLPDIAEVAGWIAEFAYDRETGLLEMAVTPTSKGGPLAEGFRFANNIGRSEGPTFRGRILQRSGKVWDAAVQGIRVFMEGFRVPPYGNLHDDWLGLERDYKSRAKRRLIRLGDLEVEDLPEGLEDEELKIQGNSAYLGAIFLNRSSSPGLEMLVNREGFLPGPELSFIAEWTRIAIDLIVRLGAASRKEVKTIQKQERARQRAAAGQSDVNETPTAFRVRESAADIQRGFEAIKQAVDRHQFKKAAEEAQRIQPSIAEIREVADAFGGEAVQWRILASLGAELAAFVHEVNAVGLEIAALARELGEALTLDNLARTRTAIRKARQKALELADRIRRNATYLVDATSFEGRRRRSRQPLKQRFETVLPFFQTRIEQKRIAIANRIPPELKTPPMFPAEVSGIFMNLLSNAVKFSNEGGRIVIDAVEADGFMKVTMANTGSVVDLAKSERLFEAFRSTTERPDAVLGQGMGMGLTITRAFVDEYGGEIHFNKPPEGFTASIQFQIPIR